jgi:hypothetical protein
MLLVCCFCDKVCDDTMRQSQWRQLHLDLRPHNIKREGTVLSYTCCHICLQGDPHAIAFRTRQSQSHAAALNTNARSRRSVAA